MLIDENRLKHWIDHFYGYGSWQAKVWFISHEESGGEVPEEVAEKIDYFQHVHASNSMRTLCNIRELYKHVAFRTEGPRTDLFSNRYEYRFGDNAVLHGVWKNLIAFVHGYRNKELPDVLQYQRNEFASERSGEEALIPLYPLPGPQSHAWYYSWLELPNLKFLRSRAMYEDHVYEARVNTIMSNILTHKPEVVLLYGMNNINALKKSMQHFFQNVRFKMVKSTKLQIPQHHRADVNGTTVLITTQIPALRHRRIETGFDWEEFGKRVSAGV